MNPIILAWILFSVVVSVIAATRNRSAIGFFVLSIITSPVLAIIILLIIPNKYKEKIEAENTKREHELQLEQIKAIAARNGEPSGIANELEKLADLRDRGVLSDEEFQRQKSILLTR